MASVSLSWGHFLFFNRPNSLPAALCQKAIFIITGKNFEWVTRRHGSRENGRRVCQSPGRFTPPPPPEIQKHFKVGSKMKAFTNDLSRWDQTRDPRAYRTVSNLWLSKTGQWSQHEPQLKGLNAHRTHAYCSAGIHKQNCGRIDIKQTTSYKHYVDKPKYTYTQTISSAFMCFYLYLQPALRDKTRSIK